MTRGLEPDALRARLALLRVPSDLIAGQAPVRTTAHGARYDEAAVVRLRTTRRLMRDLGTNLAGAQVALHLLDQLAEARREIALLQAQLADLQTRRATDSP